jgi:hypothetical protein
MKGEPAMVREHIAYEEILPRMRQARKRRLVGMISLNDLLHARTQNLEEERVRQRALRIHMPFPRWTKSSNVASAERLDHRD